MKNIAKISIIMPNYNSQNYLRETIKSITQQTYQNWELIIVDDNSNIKTKNILKSLKNNKRIKVFFLKQNKGDGYCRIYGIKKSKSRIIAFIDSDDLWNKNKLSQQILDGLSLNEIAIDNNLNIEKIKNAELQNIKAENDLIKNQVIKKAFASNQDFVSDVVDVDDNRFIIINVDGIENEKPYKLNEVFKIVSNDWINTLKIESIERKVNEIKENSSALQEIANFVDSKILNEDIRA